MKHVEAIFLFLNSEQCIIITIYYTLFITVTSLKAALVL